MESRITSNEGFSWQETTIKNRVIKKNRLRFQDSQKQFDENLPKKIENMQKNIY